MKRHAITFASMAVLIAAPLLFIPSPLFAHTTAIVAVCLFLWLSETVPPFVPTLLLWTLIPLVLGSSDPKYDLASVLSWAADPVLVLFFGGFALGVATETYGLDKRLTDFAFRFSGRSYLWFLFIIMSLTAFLSMWMSNIAAAALVFACLRSSIRRFDEAHVLRRTMLVGVALGADLGGIATPIGTGPNAIAIGAIAPHQPVSFLNWMSFGLPLATGMLLLAFAMLARRVRKVRHEWSGKGISELSDLGPPKRFATGEKAFFMILVLTAAMWLTEPVHKVPSSVIALAAAAILFLSGMLRKRDILRIDWSTLLLIAGGITLGRLLEQTRIVHDLADSVPFSQLDPTVTLLVLCVSTAILSALMSNTATAVLIIPLALALLPYPSTAILIAVSASFGLPLVISTPQNAMAFGEGGPRFGDLFGPGFVLMILGCLIVSLTGRTVLNFAGIP